MAENVTTENLSCDLIGLPSFILQFVLGCIAFSTLILKRFREPAPTRRPIFIWMADSAKQAIAMLGAHFCNLLLAQLLPINNTDKCILYLLNFLLDSTLGILIIYVLFKIIKLIVNHWNIVPLKTGEYGTPFHVQYWMAQCGVVILVMLIMKLIVGPLVIFDFWEKVGAFIMPFHNKELRTAIVIFIVPFIVNVIMFWIVDSIIMRSSSSSSDIDSNKKNDRKSSKITFKKKRQMIYLPVSNGDVPEVEEVDIPSDSNDSTIIR